MYTFKQFILETKKYPVGASMTDLYVNPYSDADQKRIYDTAGKLAMRSLRQGSKFDYGGIDSTTKQDGAFDVRNMGIVLRRKSTGEEQVLAAKPGKGKK